MSTCTLVWCEQLSEAGVPRAAVIAGTLTTIVNFFAPAHVFGFLLATSWSIALLDYLVIAVSQLHMRSKLQKQNAEIAFRMWLYPWLTWAVIVFIVFALGVMFVMPQHRLEVTSTLALAVSIALLGVFTNRKHTQTQRTGVLAKAV